MFVISVLAFFNAHGSLEDHFLVIKIPWINKVLILSILLFLYRKNTDYRKNMLCLSKEKHHN